MQFTFDNQTLDIERRELLRDGAPIPVQPQVFDLLVYLVQNRDRVVSKEDLIGLVWGGRTVSDSTFNSRVNAARTAIGDSGKDQKLIRTISRKGLRFVGDVQEPADSNRQRVGYRKKASSGHARSCHYRIGRRSPCFLSTT